MAQVSRKNHYVPSSYLARFTDTGASDGRVWVFDLSASRCFQQKPQRIAYELDFNRVNIQGHPPDVLERGFADLIEGPAASVIRRICDQSKLPEDEDFNYVLNLMALLAVRHPAMRRSMAAARHSCYRAIAELLASNRTLYEHHLKMARDG